MAAIDYHVIEGQTGQPADQLSALYNQLGADGWKLNYVVDLYQNRRRAIFVQAGAVVEYYVTDYATGQDTAGVEATLDSLGADGWMLAQILAIKQDQRRAIMMRGPGVDGGGAAVDDDVRWVPYTGPPQSFLVRDMTRDGKWTMVANKDTSDRPAPQPSGSEEDLLPVWVPAVQNARASYTVFNEWTLANDGWITRYGFEALQQNLGALHAISLQINGIEKDTVTFTPNVAQTLWCDITPIVVAVGAVIRVSAQVTQISNDAMYWQENSGLFATAPVYTTLARGSKDSGPMTDTAYGCHLMFAPGTASPDWDLVAYGGAAGGAGGGGGIQEAPQDGKTYGRMNAAWEW